MKLSELKDIIEEIEEAKGEDFDVQIECHFQPNYPLKGRLENVRLLNGKLAFAVGNGGEYGSAKAWECGSFYDDDDEDEE